MVLGADALAGIDHKNHCIGLRNGLAGLLGHFFEDAALGGGLETTGVDDNKFLFAVFGIAVVAVSREASVIGNDGVTGFGDAVKQGRFTHIGAAHQSNHRFHNEAL